MSDKKSIRERIAAMLMMRNLPPISGVPPLSGAMPPGEGVPGQEHWAAGGMGNPNMRVPTTAPAGGNDWSLANQGYFAPMGPPDYRYGVGEGGKPAPPPGMYPDQQDGVSPKLYGRP
jgi:hypothetical protein